MDSDSEDVDVSLVHDGRIMEILSAPLCREWLKAYWLTGCHGLVNGNEGFIHIVDFMVNQHAKWLRTIASISWQTRSHRRTTDLAPMAAVFRTKLPASSTTLPTNSADCGMPPDANCLLSINRCLRGRRDVNVIVGANDPSRGGSTSTRPSAIGRAGIWD